MKFRSASTSLVCSALLMSTAVFAPKDATAADAPDTTPGLWEMTMDLGGEHNATMKQAMEAMANASPQEREMMQNMMNSMGIQMTKPNVIRICITPEQAAKKEIQIEDMDDCKQEIVEQSSKQLKIKFQCPDASGDATVTFKGPKAYSTVINSKVKTDEGVKDFQQKVDAKWIKSECQG